MANDTEINQLPLEKVILKTDVVPFSRNDSFTNKTTVNDINIVTAEFPYQAGEQITSLMGVALINGQAVKFNITDEAHYEKCIGIATQSVVFGETVNVVREGKYQNSGLILVQGDEYYINSLSELTNVPPTTGILQPIGIAIETDTLLIKIQDSTIQI